MFKLTIVSGPNRGASYSVKEGETSIGRQTGNVIQLPSNRVSKTHCVLVVGGGEVTLQDKGSSNGTFVNGVLTRGRKLRSGDKIGVGEFVFELTAPRPPRPPITGGSPGAVVLQFPQQQPLAGLQGVLPPGMGMPTPSAPIETGPVVPSDLKGKALFYFEQKLMPFFYGLNTTNEWRFLCLALFGAFLAANLVIAVRPVVESGNTALVREVTRRAQSMAREIAYRNNGAIAARAETRTEIGSPEREESVRLALLVDLDGRIIAPGSRMNQYLASGPEAAFLAKAREAIRGGRETGIAMALNSSTVAAIEPVKVLNPQLGRNVIPAVALVSIDSSLATPDVGQMGVVYGEVFILTALLGGLLLLVLYHLTLKPFHVLNDDIDKVLKGDLGQVTHAHKMEELDPLWDVIGSALQRAKSSGPGSAGGPAASVEDSLETFRMIGDAGVGLVLCDSDRRVLYLSPKFEEISGIRASEGVGQELSSTARDQAFAALVTDLFGRAQPGSGTLSENLEFSGTEHKIQAAALGSLGSSARGYVLIATKGEG